MLEKKVLVCGAAGFIGSHLVKRLKKDGCYVVGVDIKYPEYEISPADKFLHEDLRNREFFVSLKGINFDEIYQLAADMGGAGYIFSGENDADIFYNSALINLNVLNFAINIPSVKVFFSSSACIYPAYNQEDTENPICAEDSAYPANPDSEYGWEKLFGERLYLAFKRNYNLDVRIARFHNIYGDGSAWKNGKEKVPTALCRKVALAKDGDEIEVWGDGSQTRSFLYIDECLEGVIRLMNSDYKYPVNIGSDEKVSINELAKKIIQISGKKLKIKNIPGHIGVRGRNSDNRLILEKLRWSPNFPLKKGLEMTYSWILNQIKLESSIKKRTIRRGRLNHEKLIEDIYNFGYCIIPSYFNKQDCKGMAKAIDEYVISKSAPRNFGAGVGIHPFIEKIPVFRGYIFSTELIELIKNIFDDTPLYCHSGARITDDDSDEILAHWHNHYGWNSGMLLTRKKIERVLMITYPLGATNDLGNLVVLPRKLNDPIGLPPTDGELTDKATKLDLPAGSVIIFDSALWHSAIKGPNITKRIIIGAHFQAESVQTQHEDDQFKPYEIINPN